jgi:hypothetical protein
LFTKEDVMKKRALLAIALLSAACARTEPRPSPKPRTLADALAAGEGKDIMKDMGYCPGEGLPGLGFRRVREAPPCPIERYLGANLKDPSSYQAVVIGGNEACRIEQDDKAKKYLVICSYRARNSFGAFALHTQRFHVSNNRVVKVEDGAFR